MSVAANTWGHDSGFTYAPSTVWDGHHASGGTFSEGSNMVLTGASWYGKTHSGGAGIRLAVYQGGVLDSTYGPAGTSQSITGDEATLLYDFGVLVGSTTAEWQRKNITDGIYPRIANNTVTWVVGKTDDTTTGSDIHRASGATYEGDFSSNGRFRPDNVMDWDEASVYASTWNSTSTSYSSTYFAFRLYFRKRRILI